MVSASRRRAPLTIALAVLAIAAGGCGDDDERGAAPATTTERQTETQPAELTGERREFERRILAALEQAPGGSSVDAECAVERLRGSLSNALVEESVDAIKRGEELPPVATDAAYEAGRRCAR